MPLPSSSFEIELESSPTSTSVPASIFTSQYSPPTSTAQLPSCVRTPSLGLSTSPCFAACQSPSGPFTSTVPLSSDSFSSAGLSGSAAASTGVALGGGGSARSIHHVAPV